MVIPVHSIVSPDNGRYFAALNAVKRRLKPCKITASALGRSVPAVHEAVDIDLFELVGLSKPQQREEMLDMAVYAAV